MYTSQLLEALHKNPLTSPIFAGVLGSEQIPTKIPPKSEKKRVFIVNTQPTTHEGEHWVVLYFTPHDTVYYFDSFGLPPPSNIYKKIRRFKHLRLWSRTLQGLSDTCGWYCMCFVLAVNDHFDLNIFGDDLRANDKLVKKEVLKRFRWRQK